MSSLRNAVSRRPHKERSQPASRAKWGLLEKHKDYSLRARDYNAKKRKLAQLATKARERNEDEFAFGMVARTQGKHGAAGGNGGADAAAAAKGAALGVEAVKLLKTQDAGYLRVVAGKGRREIERVEGQMKLAEAMLTVEGKGVKKIGGTRVVSMDAEDEEAEILDDAAERTQDNGDDHMAPNPTPKIHVDLDVENEIDMDMDMDDHDLSASDQPPTSNPRSQKAVMESERRTKFDLSAERARRKRLGEVRAAKLVALKKRQREIMAAAEQLELQRAKMARSVGGVNRNGVRFKIRERKK